MADAQNASNAGGETSLFDRIMEFLRGALSKVGRAFLPDLQRRDRNAPQMQPHLPMQPHIPGPTEPPLRLIQTADIIKDLDRKQIEAYLKVPQENARLFVQREMNRAPGAPEGRLAGLAGDQVRLLHALPRHRLEKFLEMESAGVARTLGEFEGPRGLNSNLTAANSIARCHSPNAGGLSALNGITYRNLDTFLKTSPKEVDDFLKSESGRRRGEPKLLAGMTADQVRIVRTFDPQQTKSIVDFGRNQNWPQDQPVQGYSLGCLMEDALRPKPMGSDPSSPAYGAGGEMPLLRRRRQDHQPTSSHEADGHSPSPGQEYGGPEVAMAGPTMR